MEALAAAFTKVEERKNNGLEPVEIDIPCFHAGKSEKRCREFAQKFLSKLNLIRGSRWDLDKEYNKQIRDMLASYCKEWQRICRTKAHGHLADNSNAQTAFKIFFNALKDDTKTYVYGRYAGIGWVYKFLGRCLLGSR